MASLRDSVKDYQEELRDGIAWVAFWKEGRSWNAELFHLEVDGTLEPFDRSRLEEIKAASLKQLAAIEHYSARIQQQLADIRVPVFLAQAGNDQLITPSTVYHAAQNFTQTRCSVQWYPKSGHVITVGPDRKEFEKDVLHFVEGLSWNEENNE